MKPAAAVTQQELRWLDYAAPAAAVCVLFLSCFLGSARKDMWLDEGFTVQLLGDQNFGHMMRALAHAADGGMPLYYLLAYGWGRVFGVNLLSLRLMSSLCVCVGVLLLWNTLRKAFSLTAVALGVTATTITSSLLLTQNMQARYYGLYFACAALVFAVHLRLSQQVRPGWTLLTGAVGAHIALIYSHPFGVLYSGAAIYALLFSDYRWGKLRWRLYLTLASSWLALLAWAAPMIRLHDVAIPHNWPPPLTLTDVLSLYAFSSPCLAFSIILVIGVSALARPAEDASSVSEASRPLLTCAIAFLFPPLAIALLSLGESSFFLDRYFLPTLIGVAAVLTSLFESRLRAIAPSAALKAVLLVVVVVFLAWPIAEASKLEDSRFRLVDDKLPNLPVIVTDAQAFLPLTYLSHRPSRPYYYPLDWDAALQSANRGITVDYKLMHNAKESGYSVDRILDGEQLRCAFPAFIVLDNPRYEWFQTHIARNPDYAAQLIGELPHSLQVWTVRRQGNASCPAN